MRRVLGLMATIVIVALIAFGMGCGGTGLGANDPDCIGPDGYNWCIPGGGWDEIHSPTVQPMDFTD